MQWWSLSDDRFSHNQCTKIIAVLHTWIRPLKSKDDSPVKHNLTLAHLVLKFKANFYASATFSNYSHSKAASYFRCWRNDSNAVANSLEAHDNSHPFLQHVIVKLLHSPHAQSYWFVERTPLQWHKHLTSVQVICCTAWLSDAQHMGQKRETTENHRQNDGKIPGTTCHVVKPVATSYQFWSRLPNYQNVIMESWQVHL